MKCIRCSTEHGDLDFKFCPTCGAAQTTKCKACQCALPEGSKFCPACGTPTAAPEPLSTQRANIAPPVQTVPPPAPIPAPPPGLARPISANSPIRGRFAKFWAKATMGPFKVWKFSETSLTEAQQLAQERVAIIAEKFKQFGLAPDHYLYSDTRLREPVIQEIPGAIVSRNSYGCFVLNTSQAMFIDIDFEGTRNPQTGETQTIEHRHPDIDSTPGFFSTKSKDQLRQDFLLQKIEEWTATKPNWGWRVYRTAAGLRLLATHDVFNAEAPETYPVFSELYADPLYTKLCKVQKCFRARLTPKPWRCDWEAPQYYWPWESANDEVKFNEWAQIYTKKTAKYSTCMLLKSIGNSVIHPEIKNIIDLHDEMTRTTSGLPLA